MYKMTITHTQRNRETDIQNENYQSGGNIDDDEIKLNLSKHFLYKNEYFHLTFIIFIQKTHLVGIHPDILDSIRLVDGNHYLVGDNHQVVGDNRLTAGDTRLFAGDIHLVVEDNLHFVLDMLCFHLVQGNLILQHLLDNHFLQQADS